MVSIAVLRFIRDQFFFIFGQKLVNVNLFLQCIGSFSILLYRVIVYGLFLSRFAHDCKNFISSQHRQKVFILLFYHFFDCRFEFHSLLFNLFSVNCLFARTGSFIISLFLYFDNKLVEKRWFVIGLFRELIFLVSGFCWHVKLTSMTVTTFDFVSQISLGCCTDNLCSNSLSLNPNICFVFRTNLLNLDFKQRISMFLNCFLSV